MRLPSNHRACTRLTVRRPEPQTRNESDPKFPGRQVNIRVVQRWGILSSEYYFSLLFLISEIYSLRSRNSAAQALFAMS